MARADRAGGQHCDGASRPGSYQVTFARLAMPWRSRAQADRSFNGHQAGGNQGQAQLASAVSIIAAGTARMPPSPPCGQHGGGQARRRLMTLGWDGAAVLLGGRESRPHGEGVQRGRSRWAGPEVAGEYRRAMADAGAGVAEGTAPTTYATLPCREAAWTWRMASVSQADSSHSETSSTRQQPRHAVDSHGGLAPIARRSRAAAPVGRPVRRRTDVSSDAEVATHLIHPNVLVLLDGPSPAEMEPEVGFEPTTFRLRVGCATTTPLGLARCRTTGRREGGVYRSGLGQARVRRQEAGWRAWRRRRAPARARAAAMARKVRS
jgi:hypothetical protein